VLDPGKHVSMHASQEPSISNRSGALLRRDDVAQENELAEVHERDDVAFLLVAIGRGKARRADFEAAWTAHVDARREPAVAGVLPVDVPTALDLHADAEGESFAGSDRASIGENIHIHEAVSVERLVVLPCRGDRCGGEQEKWRDHVGVRSRASGSADPSPGPRAMQPAEPLSSCRWPAASATA
jgi:hypothetical protein